MTLATERQIAAAQPDASTWLAANAGSGKTRVLTNRVARLLLHRVPPQHILCLTYTKAAAGEMQNRLFATLGGWAMKPDDELRDELRKLGETGPMAAEDLSAVRRLFARAIETPGGLKIQTIHAFCAALLRRFPLEAGVSPDFTEIDDRTKGQMIETVVDAMADDPEEAPLVDALARQMNDDGSLVGLCTEILSRRDSFPASPDAAALWAELGLPKGYDTARLVEEAFAPGDVALLERLLPYLQAGSSNDVSACQKLAPLHPFTPSPQLLAALEGPFLYGKDAKAGPFSAKVGKFPTGKTREKLPLEDREALDALMQRVADARAARVALQSAEQTLTLHRFAAVLLRRVAALKQARGWLDFDDLILRTKALLADPAVAQWVLYKLDGGLDHILVDEAQDTSPDQWEVIRLLAQDMIDNGAASGRTLFVVGDKKQSIYSFQGADPDEFDRLRSYFSEGFDAVDGHLHDRELAHSFRSAPAILNAVDATFAEATGLGRAPDHIAFRETLPGRVDLWPPILPPEKEKVGEENVAGWDPVDKLDEAAPTAQLAAKIAGHVKDLLETASLPGDRGVARPLSPGDILILFRRRSTLFFETMAALKKADLDVAGADRIRLTEELAARDILALLRFLALPEDDLSLAAALRSPLFGWSEDRLFRLAHPRPPGSYLWHAMRRAEDVADTYPVLDDLRNKADYLRPFDLIERILTRHGGRFRLLARLGPECEEAIDGLLQQALDYERVEVPNLTGFLEWMGGEDVVIKRQAEGAGSRIRLMTVHGAKGLEAPVVILPDCGVIRSASQLKLLPRRDAAPAWRPRAEDVPPALQPDMDAVDLAMREERNRLLYVAMTRAEQWLIVAAAGDLGKQTTWHGQVEAGLAQLGAVSLDTPAGGGVRLQTGDWSAPVKVQDTAPSPLPVLRPAWADRPAPAVPHPEATLAPSGLGGAKALPGEGADEATALTLGTRIHLLLQHLPEHAPAAWPGIAARLLSAGPDPADATEIPALLAEATAVLSAPDLAPLFTDGLAEVPLSAHVPVLGRTIAGDIDRLIVRPDRVLAVDFKTNRTVPAHPEDTPEGLLRQMGAYAAALAAIYPEREIETAILWTRTARLMPLPHDLVMAALGAACSTS